MLGEALGAAFSGGEVKDGAEEMEWTLWDRAFCGRCAPTIVRDVVGVYSAALEVRDAKRQC